MGKFSLSFSSIFFVCTIDSNKDNILVNYPSNFHITQSIFPSYLAHKQKVFYSVGDPFFVSITEF